jgi:hypothetical protein
MDTYTSIYIWHPIERHYDKTLSSVASVSCPVNPPIELLGLKFPGTGLLMEDKPLHSLASFKTCLGLGPQM